MNEKRKQELLLIALRIRAAFDQMTTDEVVAVLSKALGDESKHAPAPYQMIWQVADAIDAQKVVIRQAKNGNIEVQFVAKKGGALNLENPKEVKEELA